MNENINVRYVDWLADSISEMVTKCCESEGEYYTICLNAKHSKEKLEKAYNHALSHIEHGDLEKNCDVNLLEAERHGKEK